MLTGGVWDAFLALPPLLGRELERVAILGNAAGTTARALGVFYPEAQIDGVELDPAVSRVGRTYFGLDDNPRLTVHDADARPFLRSTDERYDLIVVDAYHQPYVPFYLATREFFRLVRERLAPGGIVALNVAAVPDDRRLVRAVGTTLAAEFPQVVEWPALRFNTIVLGLSDAVRPRRARAAAPLRAGGSRSAARAARARRSPPRAVHSRLDGRPSARRVGDGSDDRLVRRAGWPARRGLPPDEAVDHRMLSLERRDGRPLCIGHRGAAALAPENTLRSFRAALEVGVDLVEFDVLDLDSGELVVAHSNDLLEVSHGAAAGAVRDKTLAALREVAPELPTLDDALAFFADEAPEIGIHVDLKAPAVVEDAPGRPRALSARRADARQLVPRRSASPRLPARASLRTGVSFPQDRLRISGRGSAPLIRVGLRAVRPFMPVVAAVLLARSGASALVLHHCLIGERMVRRLAREASPSSPGRSTTRVTSCVSTA